MGTTNASERMPQIPASSALGWEKWDDWYSESQRSVTDWLCHAVNLAPGKRVLDVACGAGHPARPAATLVRPGGKVVAIDVSGEMLQVAERKARAAGVSDIEFLEMSGDSLDFPDGSFDAVTCGFGLMFFPDPMKGVAEMRRVLVPGGRFALSTWSEPSHNPFFTTVFQALGRFMPSPAPDPNAPGMFRLGPEGVLDAVLRAGGFSDFTIEGRPFSFEFASLAEHWQLFSEVVPAVRAAVTTLPEAELARLRDAVAESVEPYMDGGRLRLPVKPWCASGRK